MKNSELYSLSCPDERIKGLVFKYAMREVLDGDGCYTDKGLLVAQYRVYEEWLAAVRKTKPGFVCCFHEWMSREGDYAFVLRPGDLVKYDGRYSVVGARLTGKDRVSWGSKWRLDGDVPVLADWPKPLDALSVKDADGRVFNVYGLGRIESADIPPEVFALACGKAKDCPMLKGNNQ